MGTDLGESHTFQYTIDISPPPKKTKTKPTRKNKPKVTKPSKPKVKKARPKVKKPTKQQIRITPEKQREARRAYEQARNQTAERKEFQRLQAQKLRRERKVASLCVGCGNQAIPGNTSCEVCRDKHNQGRNRVTAGKPRRPKLTPEERIEARREYERARAQKPERKEAARLRAKKRWQERNAARLAPPQ